MIAETDEKVVELVETGSEEEIEKARETARRTVSNMLDRGKNGQMTEISAILNAVNPDEDTKARQSVIKRYLGSYLLDPSQPPPSLKVYDVWQLSSAGYYRRASFHVYKTCKLFAVQRRKDNEERTHAGSGRHRVAGTHADGLSGCLCARTDHYTAP